MLFARAGLVSDVETFLHMPAPHRGLHCTGSAALLVHSGLIHQGLVNINSKRPLRNNVAREIVSVVK